MTVTTMRSSRKQRITWHGRWSPVWIGPCWLMPGHKLVGFYVRLLSRTLVVFW